MQTGVTDTKTTVWTKKMRATVSDIQTAFVFVFRPPVLPTHPYSVRPPFLPTRPLLLCPAFQPFLPPSLPLFLHPFFWFSLVPSYRMSARPSDTPSVFPVTPFVLVTLPTFRGPSVRSFIRLVYHWAGWFYLPEVQGKEVRLGSSRPWPDGAHPMRTQTEKGHPETSPQSPIRISSQCTLSHTQQFVLLENTIRTVQNDEWNDWLRLQITQG